jgi:ribose transport system ATP-binding protein
MRAGEVVGFVGLRGAGQDCVGRALFGLTPATGGRMLLDGRAISPSCPREAIDLGINLVCADRAQSVVSGLSIRENLFLNPVAAGLNLVSYLGPDQESLAAVELGERIGLRPNDPSLPIEWLSGGNQQKVVVGRWLHLGGKVYVFEDPTAGVDVGAKAEIYRLFDVVLKGGTTILLVSTDFEEVAKVCHRALVFDRGQVVAELSGGDLSAENLLAAASASVGQVHRALERSESSRSSDAVSQV